MKANYNLIPYADRLLQIAENLSGEDKKYIIQMSEYAKERLSKPGHIVSMNDEALKLYLNNFAENKKLKNTIELSEYKKFKNRIKRILKKIIPRQ